MSEGHILGWYGIGDEYYRVGFADDGLLVKAGRGK